jgi:hypothetical protein
MAMYLTRFSYTPETWARMIENPEDRRDAARTYIESVSSFETTVLLTVEDTMEALGRAKSIRYRPPSA